MFPTEETGPNSGLVLKSLVVLIVALLCTGLTVSAALGQDKGNGSKNARGDKTRAELEAEVKALKEQVAELKAEVATLRKQVGETEDKTQQAVEKLPVVAKAEVVNKAGGTGGGWEYEVRCKDGHQPVGVWGASGAVIDSLGLVCRKKGSEDLWRSDQVGGNGGSPYEILCSKGELIGLEGKAGAVIDSVTPICSKKGSNESAGGKGGNPYELRCPKGKEFQGLAGKYGAVVDSVQLICE